MEVGQNNRYQDEKLGAAEIADIAAERIASELKKYLDERPELRGNRF